MRWVWAAGAVGALSLALWSIAGGDRKPRAPARSPDPATGRTHAKSRFFARLSKAPDRGSCLSLRFENGDRAHTCAAAPVGTWSGRMQVDCIRGEVVLFGLKLRDTRVRGSEAGEPVREQRVRGRPADPTAEPFVASTSPIRAAHTFVLRDFDGRLLERLTVRRARSSCDGGTVVIARNFGPTSERPGADGDPMTQPAD